MSKKISDNQLSEVARDWLQKFPELSRFNNGQKLLRRVGPVVFGIELEKFMSDTYRPKVVAYNLLDAKQRSLIRIMDQSIRDSRGNEEWILYAEHSKKFSAIANQLRKQSLIDFQELELESIIKGIIQFVEDHLKGNCFWSCQAILQLSLELFDQSLRENFFQKGIELMTKNLPSAIIGNIVGDLGPWLANLQSNSQKHNEIERKNIERFRLTNVI